MKNMFDFLQAALPWIATGLFVACSCVTVQAKSKGKEMTARLKALSWSPVACFLFVAVMEMYSGNISSGTTWLVLGVFNAVVNFSNTKNGEKE